MQILCISKSSMFLVSNSGTKTIHSQALDRYRKNADYIKHKNDWKKKDEQALVMQMMHAGSEPMETSEIKGASFDRKSGSVYYTIHIENFTGLYEKQNLEENAEGIILSDTDKSFCEIDLSDDKIILSIASGGFEKHLGIIERGTAGYSFLTEGDSVEENPVWSKKEEDTVFYSSAGLCHTGKGILKGPFALCKLNLTSYNLEELLSDPNTDYIKPKEDAEGNLYFIRRPYGGIPAKSYTFTDIITAPVKIVKAIIEWLNFFTQTYTGQPLNSGGNDVKAKNKSAQQIFIEGNLIDADKILKENSMKGEKYPGLAPKSWELCRLNNNKKIEVVKKGVLDYAVDADGTVVYSNGKHILSISKNREETHIGKADLVTKIVIL